MQYFPTDLEYLQYALSNDRFQLCRPLSADQFCRFCRDRGISVSRERLERLERLNIIYPIARGRHFKVVEKLRPAESGGGYVSLGAIQPGEKWPGETAIHSVHMQLPHPYAERWLEEGLLWAPASKPFEPWDSMISEDGYTDTESFYSMFQCYTLGELINGGRLESDILADEFVLETDDARHNRIARLHELAAVRVSAARRLAERTERVAAVCQLLTTRYYPYSQSDRRTIRITGPTLTYHGQWTWEEWLQRWDAQQALNDLGLTRDEVSEMLRWVRLDALQVDPLREWYSLVTFVNVEKKQHLRGDALFAQELYSMETMLRLFHNEITSTTLPLPQEVPEYLRRLYGPDALEDEYKFLEHLANQYHLNPRPRLIFGVEGTGEEEHIPRLAEKLFHLPFARVGVRILNLHGVNQFTGAKKEIKLGGAMRRYIDHHHDAGTLVYLLLDNHRGVHQAKTRLVRAASSYTAVRTVTRAEYVRIWKVSIEFDNFSDREIARALTTLAQGTHRFTVTEMRACRVAAGNGAGDVLEQAFRTYVPQSLGIRWNKTQLLGILIGYILADRDRELRRKRPRKIVGIVEAVVRLASRNHPHIGYDVWELNQRSGFFGAKRRAR